MNKNIFLVFFLFILAACSSKETPEETETEVTKMTTNMPDNFEINGQISGAANQPLTLEAISNKGTIKLAETTVSPDGKFFLKGNIQGMGMYQLKVGVMDNKVVPLTLEPKDKVTLNANYDNFELLPAWSGTKWAKPLTTYMVMFNEFALQQMELAKDKSLTQDQQIARFLELRKPLDNFAKSEMLKDLSNPANIVLTTSLTPAMGFQYWDETFLDVLKQVAFAYKKKYKESPIALSMLNQVKEIEKALIDFKQTKSGSKMAPEIALKNPEGKLLKLSSLKGNVVLVDFWASWCGPCRRENPNVVKLYNKYKSKGFTVFSVSLDSDAQAWKRAIKSDGLIWPYHVSDLKMWQTPLTQVYGFNSIPFTALVGRDGKIVATNLRGAELEQKLLEVLK